MSNFKQNWQKENLKNIIKYKVINSFFEILKFNYVYKGKQIK